MKMLNFHGYKRQCDIRYLTPLLTIGLIFAVAPIYNSKKRKFLKFKWQKWYALAVLFAIALGYLIPVQFRYMIHTVFRRYQAVLDIYSSCTTTLVFSISVMSINFWNSNNYIKFMNNFIKIDRMLQGFGLNLTGSNICYYAEVIASQTVTISIVSVSAYAYWYIEGMEFLQHYMVEQVERFHVFFSVLLLYNYILSIKQRFIILNKLIIQFPFGSNETITYDYHMKRKVKITTSAEYMESISKVFLLLREQIELFNKIFGWVIFFLTLNIISSNLFLLAITVVEKVMYISLLHLTGILWVIMVFLMGVMIASATSAATKEARNFGDSCYNLLRKLRKDSKLSKENSLHVILLGLVRQTSVKSTWFSAAGFFDINYAWLFTIINLTSSYFVVLLQLNNK